MTERRRGIDPKAAGAEAGAEKPGRDFAKLAWEVRSDPARAALMQPGDFITMPKWQFTGFYGPVPLDPVRLRERGLDGFVKVTLTEIETNEEGRIKGVVLASNEDDPEKKRRPVDASLFYNYGTEGRWERH